MQVLLRHRQAARRSIGLKLSVASTACASYRSRAVVLGKAAVSLGDVARLTGGALAPIHYAAGRLPGGSIKQQRGSLPRRTGSRSVSAAGLSPTISAGFPQLSFEVRQAWRSVERPSSTSTASGPHRARGFGRGGCQTLRACICRARSDHGGAAPALETADGKPCVSAPSVMARGPRRPLSA